MKKMNIILLLCLSMCFLLIDSTNEFSCIHAEQHVKIEDNNEISYVVTSTLRNSGSAKILEAGIVFVYGHCSILDNSISFAYKSWPSFTLSGGSVETTLVKRVTNTGSVLN